MVIFNSYVSHYQRVQRTTIQNPPNFVFVRLRNDAIHTAQRAPRDDHFPIFEMIQECIYIYILISYSHIVNDIIIWLMI